MEYFIIQAYSCENSAVRAITRYIDDIVLGRHLLFSSS